VKAKLFNLVKIVVSTVMLAYVLLSIDLSDMGEAVAQAEWGYLILAAALMILSVPLRAVRWLALLRALEIDVPLRRLVKLYFVGTFFNIFLPTGFGGDAVRMVELSRVSQQGPEAIGTVLVDRATGLWVLFALALVALPFGYSALPAGTAWLVGGAAAAGLIGGWLAMGTRFVPWLGSKVKLPGQAKLERLYQAVSGCGYPALVRAGIVSLIFNLLNIATQYLIALGMHVTLPIGVFFLFTPILAMSRMLPSVGGLGVREETSKQIYRTVGVPDTIGVAMSLTVFLFQPVLPGVIGGLLYAIEGATELRSSRSRA
jgi:uncharacterized membrane protein YbhN (UPF0104 family)